MSPNDGREWTNLFVGKIRDGKIDGNWTDVRRGKTLNAGTLNLQILDAGNKISVLEQTGGFGIPILQRRDC
jgi:hypothetical protein